MLDNTNNTKLLFLFNRQDYLFIHFPLKMKQKFDNVSKLFAHNPFIYQ